MLTHAHQQFYQANGYVVVAGLYSPAEVAHFLDHYMTLRASPQPGDDTGIVNDPNDPIKRYPRILMPQKWDDLSRQWMLDPRINACLTGLLGNEPFAAQTMVYFKPPGARGQALHQDQLLPAVSARHVHGGLAGARRLRRSQWLPAGGARQPPMGHPVHRGCGYRHELYLGDGATAAGRSRLSRC